MCGGGFEMPIFDPHVQDFAPTPYAHGIDN